ncbi:MAG: hypothetical protein LBR22_04075 [Desulfovibrio sp.]|jgi:ATP-dependent DNA helicase RecG|nr:hypothetical protein [Desulfovibrio sp.]
MLREALSYIQRNYISTIVIKHEDRAESDRVSNFPFQAIEEALANAVYHRGYDVREPITVEITPDEIIVISRPGPDRSINMEDLAQGRAVIQWQRNRRIGEFLKDLELTEGRGTGLPKIHNAMLKNGSPPPKFLTNEHYSYFATILPIHPEAKSAIEKLRYTPKDVLEDEFRDLPPKIAALVKVLAGCEMKRCTLQNALGIANRDYFRKAYLLPALKTGFIEMTRPNNPTDRGQRYRVTSVALATGKPLTQQIAALVASLTGEMTRQELQDSLGLANRDHFRKAYIMPALNAGLIEMTKPDAPNSRSQRYRLTSRGRICQGKGQTKW